MVRRRRPTRLGRRAFLATGAAALLAGCIGQPTLPGLGEDPDPAPDQDPDSDSDADQGTTPPSREAPGSIPVSDPPGPLDFAIPEFVDAAANSAADTDQIPALDDPDTTTAADGDAFLDPADVVFGVSIDGEARAYPQPILVWHEIANDTLAGVNYSVTYCPLTGTAIGYERGNTTFGVEGWLINSNLILFDRETHSWWPQVLGTAVDGAYQGFGLRPVPVVWTRWEDWKTTHPDTTVLTTDTGYLRDYNRDPYGWYAENRQETQQAGSSRPEESLLNYYTSSRVIFPVMASDDRHHPKAVVIGARTPEGAVAVLKDRLATDQVLEGSIGNTPFAAVYDPVLDTGYTYLNPDDRQVEPLNDQEALVDDTAYPLADLPLEQANAFDAMWFAWHAFYPQSTVID